MKNRLGFLVCCFSILLVGGCFTDRQAPAPVTHYGGAQGAGSAGVHTVMHGDTLYSISQRYNIALQDIAAANSMRAPFLLRKGQRLTLPPPREYAVRQWDTLYSISRLFNVSTSEIARLNDLQAPYTVAVGDILRLPSVTHARADSYSGDSGGQGQGQSSALEPVRRVDLDPSPSAEKVASANVPPPKTAAKPKPPINAKTPKRSSSKFLRPVSGPVVSSYGPKKNGLHNDGINIKAARGTPVKAAENGVIVYAGSELKGSGNLVLIRHDGGWMTAYAHMDKITAKRGAVVSRGDTIGNVGSTGFVDSPQLHFEVRKGTNAVNPKPYIDS